MTSTLRLACLTLLVGLSACAAPEPAAVRETKVSVAQTGAPQAVAILAGIVLVPTSVISNNGGAVIGEHGSGFALLATSALAPLPGAHVTLHDTAGGQVVSVAGATTDADGRFTLVGLMPPAGVYEVRASYPRAMLSEFVTLPVGAAVTLDPATTLAHAHLAKAADQARPGALAYLASGIFDAWTSGIRKGLAEGKAAVDVSSQERASGGFDGLVVAHPELAKLGDAVLYDAIARAARAAVAIDVAPRASSGPGATGADASATGGAAGSSLGSASATPVAGTAGTPTGASGSVGAGAGATGSPTPAASGSGGVGQATASPGASSTPHPTFAPGDLVR